MARDLLDITDLSADEVATILDLAQRPVEQLGRPLAGQGAALIFEKPSNRTRHSMEMAVVQLGGHPVYTRGEEVGFDVREPVEDVGRILDGLPRADRRAGVRPLGRRAARRRPSTCRSSTCCPTARHPLQALADVLTMQQLLGDARRADRRLGRRLQQRRPLARRGVRAARRCTCASPVRPATTPTTPSSSASRCSARHRWRSRDRVAEAVDGADAVHTDTWVSMGQEADKQERIDRVRVASRSTRR